MLYDITGHALLSDQAAALGPTELVAHARVAESLLGLNQFTAFNQTNQIDLYSRTTDAVAMQVSYQVESGVEAFVLAGETRGARHKSYRGGTRRRMQPVHPTARKIVSAIKLVAGIII